MKNKKQHILRKILHKDPKKIFTLLNGQFFKKC